MDVLALALVVALMAWSARHGRTAFRRWRGRRARLAQPGASADHPLIVTSRPVLEAAREALRCDCGGRVTELGEGPRAGLRVARGRCVECDADVDLYFAFPHLLN